MMPKTAVKKEPTVSKHEQVDVKLVQKGGQRAGVFEMTVRIDNKPYGRTLIATSPRELAFERR